MKLDYKAVLAVHNDYEKLEEILKTRSWFIWGNTQFKRLSYVIQKWLNRVHNWKLAQARLVRYVQVVQNNRWNSISVRMRIFQCSDTWKVPWFVFPLKQNYSLLLILIFFHYVNQHQITHDYFLNQVCEVNSSFLRLFDLYLLKRCETPWFSLLEKLTVFPEIPPARVWVHLQSLQNSCTVKQENYIS